MIEHLRTHVAEALLLPLGSYRGKPRFEALLASYIKEVQKLEDAIWSVILGRMLENAEGIQLDVIGKLVGQKRRGMDDDTYRVWITVRIRINRSHGRPKDILEILRLVEQTGSYYREVYPCTVSIEFDEATDVDPNVLAELMREANSAGIMIYLLVPPAALTVNDVFAFSNSGAANVAARGFGHEGSTDYGGELSSSYY